MSTRSACTACFPVTHHSLRVDDVSDTHLLDLSRVEQTELDLLNALQRRTRRREVEVRHDDGVVCRSGGRGTAMDAGGLTATSLRRLLGDLGLPPHSTSLESVESVLRLSWRDGRDGADGNRGARRAGRTAANVKGPAGLMRPGRAWVTRSGRGVGVGGVATPTAGETGPSRGRSATGG